jgi:hypothetical protein
MQVRDLLYVDDLIEALLLAEGHLPEIAGQAFNIGDNLENTISLCELVERISALNGDTPEIAYGPWRVGDQRWYVSEPSKFERVTGWRPKTLSTTAFGSCTTGFPSIAGQLRRRGLSDHEGSADKPKLVIRGQYLFWMLRTAFTSRIRLRQGFADARRS